MIMINEPLKFDTIKLVTSSEYLISVNKHLFKNDVDLSTGEVKSVVFNSKSTGNIVPFELYIHANYQSGKMTIEFSSKLLLDGYPQLISGDNLSECLRNVDRMEVCTLNVDGVIGDCCITKLHITKDVDLELTSEILNRLNLCTGDYRRYKWNKYDDGILFYKNVKSADCKESMTIYNKEKEILLSKNRAFLNAVSNAEDIKKYFCGKTRFELQLNNKRKIMKVLDISDTSVKTVMNISENVLLAQFDKIFTEETGISKSSSNIPLAINSNAEYGMLNTIRYYDGDLKKIEQEIKDLGIYANGSRAAMGRQMKRFKEMAHAWSNREMNVDTTIEQIRNLLKT